MIQSTASIDAAAFSSLAHKLPLVALQILITTATTTTCLNLLPNQTKSGRMSKKCISPCLNASRMKQQNVSPKILPQVRMND